MDYWGGKLAKDIKIDSNTEEQEETKTEDTLQHHSDKKTITLGKVEVVKKEFHKDNEDLSIDFSEIKNKAKRFFKSLTSSDKDKHSHPEHKHHKKEVNDDELSVDFSKITTFAKTNAKWIIPALFILIAMFASVYLRTMPLRMSITDEWADNTVNNFYQNQVTAQINQQYPNLPQQNRDALVQNELQKLKEKNKDQVNNDIKQVSQQYKDQFRDDQGTLYLLGIDPYYFYRQTEYRLENGHPGNSIKDGKYYDSYRAYPTGSPEGGNFHTWFGAFLHRFLSSFSDVPLMFSFFLIGTIFSALTVIPAFFIGKKITKNNVGGFFVAILIAVSAFFVSRTTGESSDTDVYVVFFPILILWLLIEAITCKDLKKKLGWTALAGLTTGLLSFVWGAWWYFFFIFAVSMLSYFAYELIRNSKALKTLIKKDDFFSNVSLFGIYIISSGLFVSIFSSFNSFYSGLFEPINSLIHLKAVAIDSLWPNILTTVAELNVAPFSQVISQVGGKLIFTLAIVGIILLMLRNVKDKSNNNLMIALILSFWLAIALYTTTRGVRFILMVAPIVAILFGAFLGLAWSYISNWTNKELNLNLTISKVVVFLLLGVLLIQPSMAGYSTAYNSVPAMNDAWHNTLTKINSEAPAEAVITSWWDFGYWFMAIAERPTTFDGGMQVGWDAHWVGKSLLTSDEKTTVGIIRMLNCGQNSAFIELDNIFNDTPKEIKIINKIIVEKKEAAIETLNDYGLNANQVASVIQYTHCEAPTDYYITSEDMVGKAGVWGHFGSWDFDKAVMYQNTKNMKKDDAINYLTKNFSLTEDEADRIRYEIQTTDADQWIASWPSYHSGLNQCQNSSSANVTCQINTQQGSITLDINLNEAIAKVRTNNGQNVSPASLVYVQGKELKEQKFDGQTIGSSLILIPNGNGYAALLSDTSLAYSTFTKLFFFDGLGTKCFEKFDEVQQFTGGKISTWIVDYNC